MTQKNHRRGGAALWTIGTMAGPCPTQLSAADFSNPSLTAKDLSNCNASFVADPFMVRDTKGWHLFLEWKNLTTGLGEIGYAHASDERLKWRWQGSVLKEPFHLSYPLVFPWDGHWYMTPETLKAGAIRLYRADPFPHRWVYYRDLIPGSFADPTPFRHDDRWWLFACAKPFTHDQLVLYSAENLLGPWLPHPANPIVDGSARFGRPAGRVIYVKGKGLIRFAQDCREIYGHQVNALSMDELTTTTYRESEIPGNPVLGPMTGCWPLARMHHVDAHQLKDGTWLACVDGVPKTPDLN